MIEKIDMATQMEVDADGIKIRERMRTDMMEAAMVTASAFAPWMNNE